MAKKMRGWPYWKTSSTAAIEKTAPSATILAMLVMPVALSAYAERIRGRAEILRRHHAGEHRADHDVDDRTDREAAQNADRQVPLRILRLLGRGRDRVEADVGEEDDRRALVDAAESVRRERMVVRRVDVLDVRSR